MIMEPAEIAAELIRRGYPTPPPGSAAEAVMSSVVEKKLSVFPKQQDRGIAMASIPAGVLGIVEVFDFYDLVHDHRRGKKFEDFDKVYDYMVFTLWGYLDEMSQTAHRILANVQ
jgi:hypothetical protein